MGYLEAQAAAENSNFRARRADARLSILLFGSDCVGRMDPESSKPGTMPSWRRLVFLGAGWGVGLAVTLAVMVGAFVWYKAWRLKQWDATAIKVSLDKITPITTHDEKCNPSIDLVFTYIMENATDLDYRLDDTTNVTWMRRVSGDALEPEQHYKRPRHDALRSRPLIIPARQRVRVEVSEMGWEWLGREVDCPAERASTADRSAQVSVRLREIDLNGFVLFDNAMRYQINFPVAR